MNNEVILGIVRHVLTIAGGALASKGILEAGQVEVLVGSAVAIAGVALSVWAKRKKAA